MFQVIIVQKTNYIFCLFVRSIMSKVTALKVPALSKKEQEWASKYKCNLNILKSQEHLSDAERLLPVHTEPLEIIKNFVYIETAAGASSSSSTTTTTTITTGGELKFLDEDSNKIVVMSDSDDEDDFFVNATKKKENNNNKIERQRTLEIDSIRISSQTPDLPPPPSSPQMPPLIRHDELVILTPKTPPSQEEEEQEHSMESADTEPIEEAVLTKIAKMQVVTPMTPPDIIAMDDDGSDKENIVNIPIPRDLEIRMNAFNEDGRVNMKNGDLYVRNRYRLARASDKVKIKYPKFNKKNCPNCTWWKPLPNNKSETNINRNFRRHYDFAHTDIVTLHICDGCESGVFWNTDARGHDARNNHNYFTRSKTHTKHISKLAKQCDIGRIYTPDELCALVLQLTADENMEQS